ncbi:hypothetical protein K0M31_011511 [Melipona bicolor]|uniref:Uncharacterized protein n=1 Tax=Melipona bicolor TaxID=60889 RepID=A0AA40KUU0_9HYME|nr:hypothetical protein K0M31_011511 [Melipona bicolor]
MKSTVNLRIPGQQTRDETKEDQRLKRFSRTRKDSSYDVCASNDKKYSKMELWKNFVGLVGFRQTKDSRVVYLGDISRACNKDAARFSFVSLLDLTLLKEISLLPRFEKNTALQMSI